MNGFSTEEDSHDGPPAPPFYGQSCCLIEDGERCGRSAGNASFSKRIQKSISQKKLKLDIDKSVSETIRACCSVLMHKSVIAAAGSYLFRNCSVSSCQLTLVSTLASVNANKRKSPIQKRCRVRVTVAVICATVCSKICSRFV